MPTDCLHSVLCTSFRDFIEKHYIDLKKTNPATPILIRECSGVLPKVYARHEKGVEVSVSVSNLAAEKIHSVLEGLVQKK